MRLTVADVDMSFRGRTILRNASMKVDAGETVALMGPSGSGKSTLLGIIAGDVVPDAGTVEFLPGANERVEWVLQSAPLLTRRSALDNIRLGPLSQGASEERATATSLLWMKRLGIDHLAHEVAHRLSGGERQRVAVCRALATNPNLVLADEPTAALDAQAKSLVMDSLARAAANGVTMVIATHDADVARVCHRTISIESGHLRENSRNGEL